MKLTKEIVKEFWELCGFELSGIDGDWTHFNRDDGLNYSITGKRWQIGEALYTELPPIDLNNLFKYAVPKVREKLSPLNVGMCLFDWLDRVVEEKLDSEQSALALFGAIYEVMK